MEEWRHIIFSGECYVYLGNTRGRIHVTRRPSEELHENCVVPTFKQSFIRVMKGPLIVLEYPGGKGNGMNSGRYQEQVLDGVLIPFHVWHELNLRLRALPHPPTTLEQLKSAVLQAWEDLPIEDVDKHVQRMPERVEAVSAAKGRHTSSNLMRTFL
ncbi:hypothetical protein FPV67DRAFT_1564293 [Lyophyllum atratum]|nr:hypothetical protein FPV67DRAFT_1564293 [Lyophyllum atratum]